jgi:hypothetical protein
MDMAKKEKTAETPAAKKVFKRFYPSMPGKSTHTSIGDRFVTVPPEGIQAHTEEEEKAFEALVKAPGAHITDVNPMIPAWKAEIETHEAAIAALKAKIGEEE